MFSTSTGQKFMLADHSGKSVLVRQFIAPGEYGPPVRRQLEIVEGRGAIRTDQPGVFAFTARPPMSGSKHHELSTAAAGQA